MTRTATKVTSHTPCPPSLLMNLVITLLAPMFLGVSAGNVHHARMAAIETVRDYRARNNADLIAVAQIIAFGLAALGSLSQSLCDEISISMALKLRGNANACHRSAEQNRRVLRQGPADDLPLETPPEIWTEDDIDPVDPEPLLTPEAAELLATEAASRLRLSDPEQPAAETPAPDAPTATAQKASEKRDQEMWAIALVKEASEITASIPTLPPSDRDAATRQAATLSSIAHNLLYGGPLPPPETYPGSAQPSL